MTKDIKINLAITDKSVKFTDAPGSLYSYLLGLIKADVSSVLAEGTIGPDHFVAEYATSPVELLRSTVAVLNDRFSDTHLVCFSPDIGPERTGQEIVDEIQTHIDATIDFPEFFFPIKLGRFVMLNPYGFSVVYGFDERNTKHPTTNPVKELGFISARELVGRWMHDRNIS